MSARGKRPLRSREYASERRKNESGSARRVHPRLARSLNPSHRKHVKLALEGDPGISCSIRRLTWILACLAVCLALCQTVKAKAHRPSPCAEGQALESLGRSEAAQSAYLSELGNPA